MSWRATAFWSLLAALVGFGLFHVKYQVQKLEDQLTRINRDIVREQEQIHVLRAEATYLNRPERIEQLAQKYLSNLAPPKPNQMSAIAQLPMRASTGTEPTTAQSGNQSAKPAQQAPTRAPLPKAPPLMTPVPVATAGLDDQSPLPGGGR
jgi:cell division protein FtsL